MRNVLIVDDDTNICRGLAENLNWKRYCVDHVFTADNALNALEIIRTKPVSLVITDVKMPSVTGLEFIQRAKQLNNDLLFIVISGYAEFDYVQQALRLQVMDYLLKPVRLNDVMVLLDKIFPTQEEEVKPPLVQISADDQSRVASPLVKSIISYIDRHYTEPITLNSIADWLERNPTYISYIFKKETNMKLFDYVMRVRIQRAQQLIASTSLSFSEIASQVGFDEYRSFVRAYQKIVGTSPRESIKKGGTDT